MELLSRASLLLLAALPLTACGSANDDPANTGAPTGAEVEKDEDPPADQEDELVAPANWTLLDTDTVPTRLMITANSGKTGGTDHDLRLAYRNRSGTYSCYVPGPIANGETKGCTPTRSSDENTKYDGLKVSKDLFYVGFRYPWTTDGLLVTTMTVRMGLDYSVPIFTKAAFTYEFDCTGCDAFGTDCNACWIDGDDHKHCTELKTEMHTSGNTSCSQRDY